MNHRLSALLLFVVCSALTALAAPSWWYTRSVIPPSSTTNDFAAINLGQLKHMASKAYEELEVNLPNGAGATISNLVASFVNSNNFAAANLGQLKTVAKPYYDRLIAEGLATNYPWTTNTSADDADFAGANIGQLKRVFAFDLDTDTDGLPDWWEIDYFGDTISEDEAGDSDGDGVTNADEYANGTDPTEADTDGDGLVDGSDGQVATSEYPQGVNDDNDGYVDGESDYGTDPADHDTDADGLVDGRDGLISVSLYPEGLDSDSDGYVDGEFDFGSSSILFDSDGDGVHDGAEGYLGTNPTNSIGSTGLNSNWIFHSRSEYARATWERVPGLWQRFLMVDYEKGTNTAYMLLPPRLGLDSGSTTQTEIRSSWPTNSFGGWAESYLLGAYYTSVVITAENPFHGLPTMGAVTLSVFKLEWPIPSIAQTGSLEVYYAPLARTLTSGVQSAYTWLLDTLDTTNAGYGANNYLYGPQVSGPQFGGNDFRSDLDKLRFRNGGFQLGTTTYHTNEPYWSGFGYDGAISTNFSYAGSRSFLSKDVDGMYQRIVVHPGEELVLGGWMYTPSATNGIDTNVLTSSRYGLISLEYYRSVEADAIRIDGASIVSTNAKDVWTYFAVTSLVPSRADYAHVSIRTVAPTMELVPPGHVYFDDISVVVSADNDQDGIPDRWETLYPVLMSSNAPSDAIADGDSDGIVNMDEYRLGILPDQADSDSDGLEDLWEINEGLNPNDESDAARDLDGDGLSSAEEYAHGTSPLVVDSDGDGIDDGTEALDLLTDPDTYGTISYSTVQEMAGTSTTSRVGDWYASGTYLCASNIRGSVTYQFTAATADIYRVEIEGADCESWRTEMSYEIRGVVDGQYVGRQHLWTDTNNVGTAGFLTPWLTAGVHSVQFEWDNAFIGRRLMVRYARLKTIPGEDADSDGRKDWTQRRLTRLSGFDSLSVTSAVSPACIEGRDPYLGFMSMAGTGAQVSVNGRWYMNTSLSSTATVTAVAAFQSGALVSTATLHWAATDLLADPGVLMVRTGDTLRFTCYPSGATSGTYAVSVVGVSNYSTRAVGDSIEHQFAVAGTYTVIGTNYPYGALAAVGATTVNVVSASFDGSPAVWAGVTRSWVCTNLPTNIVVETGVDLLNAVDADAAVRTLLFWTDIPENHGIVARIGANGPIVACTTARGFRFGAGADTGSLLINTCATGDKLFENPFVLSPPLDDLTLKGDIIRSGVFFDDATYSKTWSSTNFDAAGIMGVRFIRSASTIGSYCNNVDVYQGTNIVGRHQSP